MSNALYSLKEIEQNLILVKLVSGCELVGVLIKSPLDDHSILLYHPVRIMHIIDQSGPSIAMTGFLTEEDDLIRISHDHMIYNVRPSGTIRRAFCQQYAAVSKYKAFSDQDQNTQIEAHQEMVERDQEYPPPRLH